jgi:flagellar biosynthetic protein FlhB
MAEGAEDRTEPPSAKRLQSARGAGQVPLSREAVPAAVLAVAGLALVATLPDAARRLAVTLAAILEHAGRLDPAGAALLAGRAALPVVAPFAVGTALAATLAVLGQTGFLVRPAALQPSFAKLDVRRNLARLLGPTGLMELGRSLLKAGVAAVAVYVAAGRLRPWLAEAALWDPAALPGRMMGLVMPLLFAVLGVQGGLAGLDVLRVRISHVRALRMSRQELREEHRESEGDPRIKARIRRIRLSRARRRMLAAVRKATVVVTNPTHYAVALAYERGAGGAPRVVAKGIDAMAAKIREVAEESRVPLFANPPLARALWQVELDAEVPATLFQAVAEVIAYVWRLRTPARRH